MQSPHQVNKPTPNLKWIFLTEHKIPFTQNRNEYILLNLCSLAEKKEHASSSEEISPDPQENSHATK